MKYYVVILAFSINLFCCKKAIKDNDSQLDKVIDDTSIAIIQSTENEPTEPQIDQSRVESLKLDFKDAKIFKLDEILKEDFNGDGIIDKAEFKKENGKSGIVITDGRSNDLLIIGLGNKFAHMDDLGWVDYWGVVKDTSTYEILFENNEISGDTIVGLDNPSIVVRKDEVGGGVITYKNGTYIWIHQAD
jgi:hypothetical protein